MKKKKELSKYVRSQYTIIIHLMWIQSINPNKKKGKMGICKEVKVIYTKRWEGVSLALEIIYINSTFTPCDGFVQNVPFAFKKFSSSGVNFWIFFFAASFEAERTTASLWSCAAFFSLAASPSNQEYLKSSADGGAWSMEWLMLMLWFNWSPTGKEGGAQENVSNNFLIVSIC